MAWNFDDFLRRLEAIKGIGSLEDLIAQVPGLSAILKDVEFNLADLDPIEKILRGMSLEERLNPKLLDGDEGRVRRERIAERSDTTVDAVDSLIWQFQELCKMLEAMSPEQVTQELMDSMQPNLQPWQISPDAWKSNDAFQLVEHSDEEEDVDEDDLFEEEEEMKPPQDPAERLDDILRKISATGMDSLTLAERLFLDETSRKLRSSRT